MKEEIKFRNLLFGDHLVLRSPVNPFDKMDMLDENSLLDIWKHNDLFRESVYIASSSLYYQIEKLFVNDALNHKQRLKLIYTITKYYKRFSTRCTPFGLFSGISSGVFKLDGISHSGKFKRVTRIDNHLISVLVKNIETNTFYRDKLKYKINSSLYELDTSYRYIEYEISGYLKKYNISALEKDKYLEHIVLNAGTYNTLEHFAKLIVDNEVEYEMAKDFVFELIDNQILVSNIEPSVVGDDPLKQLITTLKEYNDDCFSQLIDALQKIERILIKIDDNGVNDIKMYEDIKTILNSLSFEYDDSNLFQVDVRTDSRITHLGTEQHKNILKEISNALNFLYKIRREDKNLLDDFTNSYMKRYGDTVQPLVKVLDSDIGIELKNNEETKQENNTAYTLVLTKKYFDCLLNKDLKIVFSETDFPQETDKRIDIDSFTSTLSVIYSLVRVDNNEKIFFKLFGGNSGIDLLGRFTHLYPDLYNIVLYIKEQELAYNEDSLLADIVFLPEARIGNILTRKPIYDFHIQYLGNTGLEENKIININDLFLTINKEKIVLFSKKYNKQVIPRLSNVHNYSTTTIPIYKFLCLLQNQAATKFLSFNWRQLFGLLQFYPRIEFGNIILSPATWVLRKEKFKQIIQHFEQRNQEGIENEKEKLKTEFNFPDLLVLSEGDNELFVNLNNKLSLETFLNEISKKQNIVLKEFYLPSNYICDSHNRNYTNEIVVSLYNSKKAEENNFVPSFIDDIKESFTLDEDWIYYKIYGGSKILEKILTNFHDQIINNEFDFFEKWFFIRYYDDGGYHLRIRFYSTNKHNREKLDIMIKSFFSYYLRQEYLSILTNDTYRREMDRYHRKEFHIEKSESIFFYDSQCIVNILKSMGMTSIDDRMYCSIINVNSMLSSFDYGLLEKYDIMKSLRESFFIEFGSNKNHNQLLRQKFHSIKNTLEKIFVTKEEDTLINIEKIKEIFEDRKKQIKLLGCDKEVSRTLIANYLHMSINRLFIENNRWYEFCTYDALEKLYKSCIARQMEDV
ncbi:MAG: lantibiotic dehydratase [Flavobacteriaceae bacterium]|jgi:thiopeptide-type bacteriocin biosynthesis protein|nr:lantibiotic dehydratase [Flavobacteriaceae bacterium]